MDEFAKFADNELDGIIDIQLLILKGHILVEYTLNCYLESISKAESSDFFAENFTFANKVKIANHFGQLGGKKENLIKELTLLNKLRNDIAHSLTYSEKHLEELFSELKKKNATDFFSLPNQTLKDKLIGALSFISGAIFAAYRFQINPKELDEYIDKGKK